MSNAPGPTLTRRPVKIRGGSLGPFLCWAVVFADIGTSIYYTPGILYTTGLGTKAALFVGMTLIAFILLVLKYSEVAWRYPEGGGVVTVATRALHPFAGLLGGLFIEVDYFLTAALSVLSGFVYLSVVMPELGAYVLLATVASLVLLGILNWLGIKESATVSAIIATAAGLLQLLVVILTATRIGPGGVVATVHALFQGRPLGPLAILTGFAGAFLAFSGLESISQLSPAMAEPRRLIAGRAMAVVVGTMVATSPLLTLWSTTLLSVGNDNSGELISILGQKVGGALVGDSVAISGALLLIFAGNTAIIGSYHVFLALSRMGFLPAFLGHRNQWRGTPHWAILLTVGVPIAVVVLANANQNLLGDLYAFGLLAAFTLTCASLDVVRWHDRLKRQTVLQKAGYWVGVLTTVIVAVAWTTNLFAKPLATIFGGGVVVIGLAIALVNVRIGQHRGRPLVMPILLAPNRSIVPISRARRLAPAPILALLPHDLDRLDAVVKAAVQSSKGEAVTFLFRGRRSHQRPSAILEVRDPYLEDRTAQRAFARAEILARPSVSDRRYAYVPGDVRREAAEELIQSIGARDMVIAEGDQHQLPSMAVDRVRVHYVDELPVLHLMSGRPSHIRRIV